MEGVALSVRIDLRRLGARHAQQEQDSSRPASPHRRHLSPGQRPPLDPQGLRCGRGGPDPRRGRHVHRPRDNDGSHRGHGDGERPGASGRRRQRLGHGPNACAWTAPWPQPSQRSSATGSSTPPPGSRPPAGSPPSASTETGPGPQRSPPPSNGYGQTCPPEAGTIESQRNPRRPEPTRPAPTRSPLHPRQTPKRSSQPALTLPRPVHERSGLSGNRPPGGPGGEVPGRRCSGVSASATSARSGLARRRRRRPGRWAAPRRSRAWAGRVQDPAPFLVIGRQEPYPHRARPPPQRAVHQFRRRRVKPP